MAAPTTVAVSVDEVEYSRYEDGLNTITATVVITGGAPYTTEPIAIELRKARRSRDAAVATASLTFTGNDPQSDTATFFLPDIVDQDLINLARHGDYFVRAEHEATIASATIGTGANGVVTLARTVAGVAGNGYSVEVVSPGGTSALSVARAVNAITVNLSVVAGVPVGAENTAVLIRNLLNLTYSTDIAATASGTGADSLTIAEGPTAFTGGTDSIVAESGDFPIRIVTVDRLKKDYLFGISLKSTSVKMPKFEPVSVTGVTFQEVSPRHPEGFGTLTFNYTENNLTNATAVIGAGADGTVTTTANGTGALGVTGNSYTIRVLVPAGTSALSATLLGTAITVNLDVTVGVPNAAANTATLIAAAIDLLVPVSSVASGTGADSISVAEGPTAFAGGTTDVIRTLNWREGSLVAIPSNGSYILRAGRSGPASRLSAASAAQSNDYVVVRAVVSALPVTNTAEELLITASELNDAALGRYLDQAISWIENDMLAGVYLEPTNVVTDRDPTTIQYAAGINAPTPIFTDTYFDFQVSPLTYFVPRSPGAWVQIWTPYRQVLRVDSLFGSIANTRVIDIDLEWIEHSEQGGLLQLVPFNQEVAFDFIGLIWVNAIRGAAELPNFWHFNMIAGLRDCNPDLQELVAKKAAIEALQAAALAFHPGLGSLSLSRDGVSESVSYNAAQQYGIYTGTITAYKEWITDNEAKLRGKYRGLDWVVV